MAWMSVLSKITMKFSSHHSNNKNRVVRMSWVSKSWHCSCSMLENRPCLSPGQYSGAYPVDWRAGESSLRLLTWAGELNTIPCFTHYSSQESGPCTSSGQNCRMVLLGWVWVSRTWGHFSRRTSCSLLHVALDELGGALLKSCPRWWCWGKFNELTNQDTTQAQNQG